MMNGLPWQQDSIIYQTQLILKSFEYWLNYSLLAGNGVENTQGSPQETAKRLFYAPFVVVSHGIEADPIFNYGNQKALEIWGLTWEEFTQFPSRKTAELIEQKERDRLLSETTEKGFCYFSGVRITSTGKRFKIDNGIIWNLIDQQKKYRGQAAIYSNYSFL
ncbi:MAG: MEKHLA domain-containing protein [Cyanobacteria bacterium P01_G01_bin.49]